MSPDAVTVHKDRWALFLDVDGILLDVAETPQRVHVSERIKQLLVVLTVQLDGAVALLSGRGLDDVDRLLSPLRFCVVGMHGCEYRESSGCVTRSLLYTQELPRGPSECTIAKAISLFMQQTPFAHRVPVLIGNHSTDESAFEVVDELGGIAIKVGDAGCTVAGHRLPGIDEVIHWLESVAAK